MCFSIGFGVLVAMVMENGLSELNITEEEDDIIHLAGSLSTSKDLYDLCLVGSFATASIAHFPSMSNTLANLWHPLGGI